MKASDSSTLRVCYFGTYRSDYSRNRILLAGLAANGVTVYECHSVLWQGIGDRVEVASGGWANPSFWWRVLISYWKLVRQHRHIPEYDIMLIGYPGQFDTFIGRLLSWWRRKPMALDLYMSLYLIAQERGLVKRNPLTGKAIKWLETVGLKLPDVIISDTAEYVDFHCQTYGLKPDRFRLVPAGADDRYFYPRPNLHPPRDFFRVIYYGSFIRNHGVPIIMEAANLLRHRQDIQFELYGDGPERSIAEEMSAKLKLENVHFYGWITKELLPEKIACSHVSLGVFGETKQSRITIQNKIWESMALGKPVISGDAETIRNTLIHKQEIFLVNRSDPAQVAEAILTLESDKDLREKMGKMAYERSLSNNIASLGITLVDALRSPTKGKEE